MKSSGPRITGQKQALNRTLILLRGTYTALCSAEEKMVRELARNKMKAVDALIGEEYATSSDRATLLRSVAILWHGLADFTDADSDLVSSLARHESDVACALLREWIPKNGKDLVEIIEELDFFA